MSNGTKQPRSGWLARWSRGARFDRNPLRRGTDRAETGLLIMLITALVIGARSLNRTGRPPRDR